ncbi:MAG: hypothetical protein C4296_13105 [Gemmataceae bacterium]
MLSGYENEAVSHGAAEKPPEVRDNDGAILATVESAAPGLAERVERLEDTVAAIAQRVRALEERVDVAGQSQPPRRRSLPSGGLLRTIWSDFATTWRMCIDPSYRVSWTTRVVCLLAVLYLTLWTWLSGYFNPLPSIPVLSQVDDLLVAYLGFRTLGWELRRYRIERLGRDEP